MKTLERTLTKPQSITKVEGILGSPDGLETVLEVLEKSFADHGKNEPLVPADKARSHILMLHDEGMDYRTMAQLSGVGRSLIGRLLYGRPSENVPPQAQLAVTASERLLSLSVNSIEAKDRKTDSTGTIRRLQALACLGHTQSTVSDHSKLPRHTLKDAMRSKRIYCEVAETIKTTYEYLRAVEPQQETPAQKNAFTKTKNEAKNQGWLPPEAWTDSGIDDPDHSPYTRDCKCKNVIHVHGTRAAYSTDGCRCAPCKEANRVGSYRNRKTKAYGRSEHNMVDAEPARQHIKELNEKGWGVKRIARSVGVGESTVWRIAYGEPGKTLPPQRILESTNQKIMSFDPEERDRWEGTVNERIDSTGTKRRIQALMSCGYSMTLIAKTMGGNKNVIVEILKSERVRLSTAEAFKAVYDKLWDVEPPRETSFEKKAYTMSKKMAQANGWLPPMAWDDDLMDDPEYQAAA